MLNRETLSAKSDRRARDRRGAMLAFVGVSMVGLLGAVALVLDAGLGYRQRRIAQTAADAAALGGAHEIMRERYDLVTGSATAEAVRNGYDATEIVAINRGPTSGLFNGNGQYVEVILGRTVPTLLGHLFNRPSWNVQARAVAGVSTTSFNCIYTLAPAGVSLHLDGEINANCGLAINSDLYAKSGAKLDASGVGVTGAVTGGNAQLDPEPSTGVVAPINPLVALDSAIGNYLTARVPPTTTCTQTSMLVVSSDMTINEGLYCHGIRVTTGSHTLTMNPGTYIIAGGGLRIETSGQIIGNGVTIILTNGPVNNPATYVPYYFGRGAKCDLRASTSGRFKGLVLIQDPLAGVTGTSYTNTFGCANDYPVQGSIYLPTQEAFFDGSNSGSQINGSLIAYKVNVSSGTKLTMNQPVTSNSVVKRISLVE